MLTTLITWFNANPWTWALLVIVVRAFVKWVEAGRPEGLIGFIKAIVSFVPQTKPEPNTDPKVFDTISNLLSLLDLIKAEYPDEKQVIDNIEKRITPHILRKMFK